MKKRRYMLTNQERKTRDGFELEQGKWYKKDPCSESWFSCFCDPLVAVFLNPIYRYIKEPRLFECEVAGEEWTYSGITFEYTEIKLGKELTVAEVSMTQRVAFGILCAKEVCRDEAWIKWADKWLDGTDRSKAAAVAADRATWPPADVAARAAADATDAPGVDWAAGAAAISAAESAKESAARMADIDMKSIARRAMAYQA
jgi:hypothetical protein